MANRLADYGTLASLTGNFRPFLDHDTQTGRRASPGAQLWRLTFCGKYVELRPSYSAQTLCGVFAVDTLLPGDVLGNFAMLDDAADPRADTLALPASRAAGNFVFAGAPLLDGTVAVPRVQRYKRAQRVVHYIGDVRNQYLSGESAASSANCAWAAVFDDESSRWLGVDVVCTERVEVGEELLLDHALAVPGQPSESREAKHDSESAMAAKPREPRAGGNMDDDGDGDVAMADSRPQLDAKAARLGERYQAALKELHQSGQELLDWYATASGAARAALRPLVATIALPPVKPEVSAKDSRESGDWGGCTWFAGNCDRKTGRSASYDARLALLTRCGKLVEIRRHSPGHEDTHPYGVYPLDTLRPGDCVGEFGRRGDADLLELPRERADELLLPGLCLADVALVPLAQTFERLTRAVHCVDEARNAFDEGNCAWRPLRDGRGDVVGAELVCTAPVERGDQLRLVQSWKRDLSASALPAAAAATAASAGNGATAATAGSGGGGLVRPRPAAAQWVRADASLVARSVAGLLDELKTVQTLPALPPLQSTIYTFCAGAKACRERRRQSRSRALTCVLPDGKAADDAWLSAHDNRRVVLAALEREDQGLPRPPPHAALETFVVGADDKRRALVGGRGVRVRTNRERPLPRDTALGPYGGWVGTATDVHTENLAARDRLARYAFDLPPMGGGTASDDEFLAVYADSIGDNWMALVNDPTIDVGNSRSKLVGEPNVEARVVLYRGMPYIWFVTTADVAPGGELLLRYGLAQYWRPLLENAGAVARQERLIRSGGALVSALAGACPALALDVEAARAEEPLGCGDHEMTPVDGPRSS